MICEKCYRLLNYCDCALVTLNKVRYSDDRLKQPLSYKSLLEGTIFEENENFKRNLAEVIRR